MHTRWGYPRCRLLYISMGSRRFSGTPVLPAKPMTGLQEAAGQAVRTFDFREPALCNATQRARGSRRSLAPSPTPPRDTCTRLLGILLTSFFRGCVRRGCQGVPPPLVRCADTKWIAPGCAKIIGVSCEEFEREEREQWCARWRIR